MIKKVTQARVPALATEMTNDSAVIIYPELTLTIENRNVTEMEFFEEDVHDELAKYDLKVSDKALAWCAGQFWADHESGYYDKKHKVFVTSPCSCEHFYFKFEKVPNGTERENFFKECAKKLAKAKPSTEELDEDDRRFLVTKEDLDEDERRFLSDNDEE